MAKAKFGIEWPENLARWLIRECRRAKKIRSLQRAIRRRTKARRRW